MKSFHPLGSTFLLSSYKTRYGDRISQKKVVVTTGHKKELNDMAQKCLV